MGAVRQYTRVLYVCELLSIHKEIIIRQLSVAPATTMTMMSLSSCMATLRATSMRTHWRTPINLQQQAFKMLNTSHQNVACLSTSSSMLSFTTMRSLRIPAAYRKIDSRVLMKALFPTHVQKDGRQLVLRTLSSSAFIGVSIATAAASMRFSFDSGSVDERAFNIKLPCASCDSFDEHHFNVNVTTECLILKWLKLILLVYRIVALKDMDDPVLISINTLVIVLALFYENPKPDSVWSWIQSRQLTLSSKYSSDNSAFIDIINSVKQAASKSAAFLNHVDVDNCGFFSIATVKSIQSEMILVGFLGEWWLIHESYYDSLSMVRVNRSAPVLLLNDLIDSGQQILHSIHNSSLFRNISIYFDDDYGIA